MIIDKKVLGELLLAAGYGELVSVSEVELISVHSPAPVSRLKESDLADFNITVELDEPASQDRDTFSPAEVLEALSAQFDVASNIVTIDMRSPNTHKGTTLKAIGEDRLIGSDSLEPIMLTPEVLAYTLSTYVIHSGLAIEVDGYSVIVRKKKERQPRHLKRLGQLKGLTIESVKTVKQGTKAYIKTTDGAGICVEHAVVVQDLHPDENIALGLLTKEDLASIAKAKRMGLIP